MTRTDLHKPSAFVPAHYEALFAYHCSTSEDGWPVPSYRVICPEGKCGGAGLCCTVDASRLAHEEGREVFGEPGHCGSCGARFVYGQLWKHLPTGAIVHLGHDCAEKYDLMMDTSEMMLAAKRAKAAVATQIARSKNAAERLAFLDATPGLAAALEPSVTDGKPWSKGLEILCDLRAKFHAYRTLSEKQVALAIKLAGEILNPAPPKPEERHVAAPTGKGIEFLGEIVSAKIQENQYGTTWKITVKVATPEGSWLAWGTAPSILLDDCVAEIDAKMRAVSAPGARIPDRGEMMRAALRGRQVRIKATLERPAARDTSEIETDALRARVEKRNSETHFVFMKRPGMMPLVAVPPAPKGPTKARVIRAFCANLAGV